MAMKSDDAGIVTKVGSPSGSPVRHGTPPTPANVLQSEPAAKDEPNPTPETAPVSSKSSKKGATK